MDAPEILIEEAPPSPRSIHLIGGPGGSRAILAASGMLMALKYLGIDKFATIGGISGGSLPLCLLAGGMSVKEIVEIAIDLRFLDLLDEDAKMTAVMADHYRSGRYRGLRPAKGLYRSEKLAAWVNSFYDGRWPENFWTLAVEHDSQILFTADGVFERTKDQPFSIICRQSQNLGDAVRASCSVPGWFTPVAMEITKGGRTLTLYDGGLSWEGRTPLSIPHDHFQARPKDIIMCDVGVEPGAREFIFSAIWNFVCGGRCITPLGKRPDDGDELLVVAPVVTTVSSFDFNAHPDQKWQAVMEGFAATVLDLNKAGRLEVETFLKAKQIIEEYYSSVCSLMKPKPGVVSEKTVKLLGEHGVL